MYKYTPEYKIRRACLREHKKERCCNCDFCNLNIKHYMEPIDARKVSALVEIDIADENAAGLAKLISAGLIGLGLTAFLTWLF